MEAEGSSGADSSQGGVGDIWPAIEAEFGWWVVPTADGLWQPYTSFRFGMIYTQEPLGVPISTTKALKMMRLGRNSPWH